MADTVNILCLACGEPSYVTEDEANQLVGCPQCGDQGIPADLDDMVTVSLTKHELRILTFWSEAYARVYARTGYDPTSRMSRVLKTIFDRISMQTETALTLGQEMADIRSSLSEKTGQPVDMVLIDMTGQCLECGKQLDTLDEEALFTHICGADDEHPVADEDSTPPYSS